ncbi:MAG: hypothetical protein MI807_06365 [Verrucomicrobiales bacterium]|nr:hypothetical protein [Verrucomicrobiales bacterium]
MTTFHPDDIIFVERTSQSVLQYTRAVEKRNGLGSPFYSSGFALSRITTHDS